MSSKSHTRNHPDPEMTWPYMPKFPSQIASEWFNTVPSADPNLSEGNVRRRNFPPNQFIPKLYEFRRLQISKDIRSQSSCPRWKCPERGPHSTNTMRRIKGLAERPEGGALLPSQIDLDFGINSLKFSFPFRRLVPILGLMTTSPLPDLVLAFSGLPQRLYSPCPPRSVRPRSSRFKKMPQGCLHKFVVHSRRREGSWKEVHGRQTKKPPAYWCGTSA